MIQTAVNVKLSANFYVKNNSHLVIEPMSLYIHAIFQVLSVCVCE